MDRTLLHDRNGSFPATAPFHRRSGYGERTKRMRNALLCAALWLTATTATFASTRIIPVAGHLPGANGTAWTTDVSLTNRTASVVTIDLIFRPEDGVARTRSLTLGANESTLLEDAVGPTRFSGTNPSAWLGQLEVRSSGDVVASAHIFTQAASGGTFGSSYNGLDPAVLSTSGSIAGLIHSGRYRSNVAFTNPSDQVASFDYTLRREDGSITAARHLDLPPHSTRQRSIGDDVSTSQDDSRLALSWSANGPGYAVGTIIDNKSGDPTSAPTFSHGVTSLFLPIVGRTPGSNATFWSTSFAAASTSDSAGSVTLVYVDSGSGQTYLKTAAMAARGTVKTDELNAFVGAPLGTGSLKITSTTGLVGAVRIFNTQDDGSTFGSAVLPQNDVVRATNVRIDGVRRDDDYRLNVAVANDDSTAAQGRVRLFDDHGREVENEPFHVEHGKSIQVSMSRGEDNVRAGRVEVETENGIPITAVASTIDNRTGDTIHHESEQENERQNELEIEISPRTSAVGAPFTFSLRNEGSNIASVSWNFGDGTTGTGKTTTHTYASAGEFDVAVLVTLAGGAIVRDQEDVHVTGSNTDNTGVIDFTWRPSAPAAGQEVSFTASGAAAGGTFQWEFPGNIRKTGNVVTFTFAAAGSYEVELELEHGASTTLHARHNVTVGGGPTGGGSNVSSIDFSWTPPAPKAGQTVSFTATFGGQPPAGSVVKWRFPNNSRPEGTTVSYTFATAGSYEVRVEIEQPGRPSIESEKNVTVAP